MPAHAKALEELNVHGAVESLKPPTPVTPIPD